MSKNSKEEFCGVCAAIPLAFASGGSAAISNKKRNENENKNKNYNMLYNISIVITIFSIAYIIYYFMFSNCKKCKI